MRVKFAVILALFVLPFAAGMALAAPGGTAADGYGGGAVESQGGGVAVAGAAQGALPFTGVDLALVTLAAALLLSVGVFIRRRAAERVD